MHLGEKFKIKPLSLIKWLFKKKISRKWENGQNRKWKGLSGQACGSRWWPAAKLLRPSITVCSVPQLWGDVPAPSLPPGTVPTTFKVGDKGLLTEWRARETRQRDTGPTSAEITTCGISSLTSKSKRRKWVLSPPALKQSSQWVLCH